MTSVQMVNLVSGAVRQFGQPRLLITDHGSQFRKVFKQAVDRMEITLVKGRVRQPSFIEKVERVFRTLRQWFRLALLPLSDQDIQRRLNTWKLRYNTMRLHSSLGHLTPQEAWQNIDPLDPIPIRTRDGLHPVLKV